MTLSRPRVILLDMGGVILDLGSDRGLPHGREDFRGRQALLARLRSGGGRASQEDLDRWLFAPWQAAYASRYERMQEERWEPHMHRLRREARCRGRTLDLLRAWFEPFAETVRPLPGAMEAVRALAGEVRLGLVSNVPLPGELYRRILRREGLLPHFTDLRFSYDEGSRKPSPAMLRSALNELGASAREAWMVGDRRASDVAAGLAAGTATVWLRGRFDQGPEPDETVGDMSELVELLRQGSAP